MEVDYFLVSLVDHFIVSRNIKGLVRQRKHSGSLFCKQLLNRFVPKVIVLEFAFLPTKLNETLI